LIRDTILDERTMKEDTLAQKKRGFMGRFRRSRSKQVISSKQQTEPTTDRETTPSPKAQDPVPRESHPDDNTKLRRNKSKLPFRKEVNLERAPTAREAAFAGPPRYDWIDIETAAAIKVQAAFRRNQVMRELAEHGISTAAMRNRSRRKKRTEENVGTDDVPSLFRCCGVGLAFGDASEEDYESARETQKTLYEERKKARAEKEEELRLHYKRTSYARKNHDSMAEAFEIVE
jgi:hypothetical protein